MRKRSLLVLALVACMLSGCSMISKTKDIIDNKKDTETTAISDLADGDEVISDDIDTTESETLETTENKISDLTVEKTVLFDADGLKLELNGTVEETDKYYRFMVDYKNGEHPMGFSLNKCVANNRKMSTNAFTESDSLYEIAPNSEGTGYIAIAKVHREMPDIDIPELIHIMYTVDNADIDMFDTPDYYVNQKLDFKTSAYVDGNFEYDDSGTEIYNEHGVKVVFKPSATKIEQFTTFDDSDNDLGAIYIENNSENAVYVENQYVTFEGLFDSATYFNYKVDPGQVGLYNVLVFLSSEEKMSTLNNEENVKVTLAPKVTISALDVEENTDTITVELTK